MTEDKEENLSIIPPETHYITEKRVLWIPASDAHLKNPWELRLYAEKLLEDKLGDEIQLTSLKVKKPGLISRSRSRIKKQEPQVQLILTIKF